MGRRLRFRAAGLDALQQPGEGVGDTQLAGRLDGTQPELGVGVVETGAEHRGGRRVVRRTDLAENDCRRTANRRRVVRVQEAQQFVAGDVHGLGPANPLVVARFIGPEGLCTETGF